LHNIILKATSHKDPVWYIVTMNEILYQAGSIRRIPFDILRIQ